MQRRDSLFEIDNEGWKAQNKGRPLWELFREVLQNHLDSDAENIDIHIDTSKRQIVTVDDGSGFNELRDAWSVFGGDKGGDPTMRGRFGRGIKEAIASCKFARIETTSGVVEFDVEEGERLVDDEGGRSQGTKVLLENPDWPMKDVKEVWSYVMKIWQPPGVQISIDLKGGRTTHKDRWAPLFTFTPRLKTVYLNDETGAMDETYRNADVHVKDADKSGSDGRLYEMGIPVKLDCEFPYYVDVQQKIPMAEQRNEPNSWWYNKQLKPKLVNALWRYDQFQELSDAQIKKDWFTEALRNTANEEAKKEWVSRVIADNRKKGLLLSSDPDSDDKVERHGFQVFDTGKTSRTTAAIVEDVAERASSKAKELADNEKHRVTPTPAEQEVINEAERMAEMAGYPDLTFQMWEWEPAPSAYHLAAEHVGHKGRPEDNYVRLNRTSCDWSELSAENIGTIVHEIAHEEGRGHDRDWESAMQDIAGELISQLR